MTHSGGKAHSTGDRGQRYEIQLKPLPGMLNTQTMGWAERLTAAENMMQSALLWPIIGAARIYDRKPNATKIYTASASGALRGNLCDVVIVDDLEDEVMP